MWIARETNRGRPLGEAPWTAAVVLAPAPAPAPPPDWAAGRWFAPPGPQEPQGRLWPPPRRGGGLRRRGGRGAGRGDHDLPGHPPGGVGRQVADEVVGAGGGEGEGGLVGAPGIDVRDAQVEGLDDEVVAPGAGVAEGEAGRPGGGGQLVRGEEELGPPLPHLDHGRLGRPLRGGLGSGQRRAAAQDAQGEGAAGQDGQPEGGGTKADLLQLDLLGGTLRTGTHRYAPVRAVVPVCARPGAVRRDGVPPRYTRPARRGDVPGPEPGGQRGTRRGSGCLRATGAAVLERCAPA